ncbi:hypothetical protein [Halotia branconii]|uniref:Uncharacterized protein n=1 Tax=Halotia branconii CENA392 TaxID=1539056 RepID=A0AAJ6NN42_9CYAN|nr:hypothetical protein [Halotia branconii]WGV23467.1 hypothetical protein QI031_16715 [Halotia branconii CENA392]WGV25674.1 hypothetical protein QI031_28805 [Halotia branconii CENA392]WGV25932.1 hypothetical protein QI031_30210 [Halotia branconii CENA392]WGV25948.1 hypothetical protein QI031_00020 [Halotia branconii CENA392]
MAEPTLTQVFGANAIQDATTITITKSDLAGLTASSNNTGESLLVAILLQAKSYLTTTNFDSNIDQSIVIDTGYTSFITRGTDNTGYRTDQLTISLSKIDTAATIDPDNY